MSFDSKLKFDYQANWLSQTANKMISRNCTVQNWTDGKVSETTEKN